MAKLGQNKHGLFPGAKHGSTGGPGTGKLKNKVNKLAMNLKNKFQANPKPPKTPTEEIADNSKSKNPRFLQSKDLPKDPKAGIRKLSPAVQEKMGYNSMSQKRMGLHQQKEERRFAQDKMMRTEGKLEKSKPSETYSNYKDFRGDMQKATIDDSTFKADSTEYAPGGTLKYDLPMKYQVRPNQSVAYNERFHKKGVEFMDRTSPDLDQDRKMPQDRAMQAGGSRPMHQATTSQIDPLTGMPLQANAPQMGNFSGFNEIPMYDQSMNPGAITQKRTGEYYSKQNTDYTNSNSSKIPLYEKNRKINKINLMEGRGPNLDSIQKVNPEGTSDALKSYYSPENKIQYKKDLKKSKESFSKLTKDKQYKL